MAQATLKEAPSKEKNGLAEDTLLNMKFELDKKYMFRLAVESPERDLPVIDMQTKRPAPHMKFKPYQNILLTSQIVWNGVRRNIRYYDGCTSIFIDEQPDDKDTIDQLKKSTTQRFFTNGYFGAYGDESMLLMYLMACGWNGDSPFRTRKAPAIFVTLNMEKMATQEEADLELGDKARDMAKAASVTKMMIHAEYLGVATMDYESGNDLPEKSIRNAYRKEALRDPANFIKSYGNTKLETKYYIDKALEKGTINTKIVPNKATWGKNNSFICDISGLTTKEVIAEKIFDFSQTEEGEEFLIQLKNLYTS